MTASAAKPFGDKSVGWLAYAISDGVSPWYTLVVALSRPNGAMPCSDYDPYNVIWRLFAANPWRIAAKLKAELLPLDRARGFLLWDIFGISSPFEFMNSHII